jgi:hypothetical protein
MFSVLTEIISFISIQNVFLCTGQNCLSINEILIPEYVDACTKDLPLFFEDSAKQRKIIFFTQYGTLTENSVNFEKKIAN